MGCTVLRHFCARQRNRERGDAIVDYALILAVIAIVSIGAIRVLGGIMQDDLDSANRQGLLAFYDPSCPEGWDERRDPDVRSNGRRVDRNGDGIVCAQVRRFRPDRFVDNE